MKNPDFSKESSEEFFNNTVNIFAKWSKEHLHFGIWDKNTRDYKEAEINTSKMVADMLDINEADIVLDAGCGVGGTSRYIVSNYGAKTIGITISEEQVKRANKLSQNTKHNLLLEFQKQDFTQTNFAQESFTKIFALESICYAPDKDFFLKEIYRILKKGGKLVIVDGVQTKFDLSETEKQIYLDFLKAFNMAEFPKKQEFFDKLEQTGFENIIYLDKTDKIAKTISVLNKKSKRWYRVSWLLSKLHIVSKDWHRAITAGVKVGGHPEIVRHIGEYGVFIAEKPEKGNLMQ